MKYKIVNIKSIDRVIPALVQEIRLHDFSSEKITIVVPDKFSFSCEMQIMSALGLNASFNINVVTLNRLCLSLMDENTKKHVLGMDASSLLTYQAFKDCEDRLEFFKSGARDIEFASHIYKTIGQFKSSRIDADELLNYSNPNHFLQTKIRELGEIYSHYSKRASGFLDSSDIITFANMNIGGLPDVENTHFIFAGFDDMTALGYLFVENTVRYSKSVCCLCYDTKEKNAYIYNRQMKTRLKNIAEVLQIGLEEIDYQVDNDLSEMLSKILFNVSAKKTCLPVGVGVSTFVAKSVNEELEFVCRAIRKLNIEGVKNDQIGIAIFDLNSYRNHLLCFADRFELKTYIDCSTNMCDCELYKFVVALAQFVIKNDYKNLIEIISNKYFNIDEFEKEIIIKFIKINEYYLDVNKNNFSLDEKINNILITISKKLQILLQNNDIISNIREFLLNCEIENTQNKLKEYYLKNGNLYQLKITDQIINKIEKVFDDLIKFCDIKTVQEFLDCFKVCSAGVEIMPLPISLDTILVTDADASFTKKDYMFVLNCNQSTAPHYNLDNGVVTDDEILKLNMSHDLSPSISHINLLARFKMFNLAHLFNNRLVITNHESKLDLISPLSKEFVDKFDCIIGGEKKPCLLFNFADIERRAIGGEFETIAPNTELDASIFLTNYSNKQKYPALYNKVQSIIGKEDICDFAVEPNEAVFKNDTISASQLETYFRCPFQHYARYMLRLKDEEKVDLQAFDVGNILHQVAEYRFKYKMLNDKQVVDKAFDDYFLDEKHNQLLNSRNRPLLAELKNEALRFLKKCAFIDKNSEFETKFVECKQSNAKINFTANGKSIDLFGKIDRIDTYGDTFRIIDYKTGKRILSHYKDLYYGQKVQLFLYAKLAGIYLCEKMKRNYECAGLFYMPVRSEFSGDKKALLEGLYDMRSANILAMDTRIVDNEYKSKIIPISIASAKSRDTGEIVVNGNDSHALTTTKLNGLIDYSVKVSQKAVEQIADGYITPSPMEKACESCPYIALCRVNGRGILPRQMTQGVNSKTNLEVD